MNRNGFGIMRILGILLVIGVLVGAGMAIFQSGQAQGYAEGLAAAGKELPAPAPYYGYGMMRPHFFPFMAGFGWFFGNIPFVLILFLIGGMFRRFAWGRHGMGYGPWAGGPHGHPWGPPPAAKEQPAGDAEKPAAPPPGTAL